MTEPDPREVSVAAFLGAAGSSSHHPDEPLPLDAYMALLAGIHPAVMGSMIRRWAEARDEFGGSSAEHPNFRGDVEGVLDRYPDGYGDA